MTNESNVIPKWITIYLWITFIITLGASLSAYFKPDALLASWEALTAAGALSLAGPLGLFVSRNMATAVVTAFGLVKKNPSMIMIILLLRIISDGLDLVNNLIAGDMAVAGMAGVMCLIEIFAFTKIKS
ncbi:MAG: hypothetical protein NWP83_09260 [Spirosomaceae bacterium]|nr:hypothetical protein [Spirosomataceae bacterium]